MHAPSLPMPRRSRSRYVLKIKSSQFAKRNICWQTWKEKKKKSRHYTAKNALSLSQSREEMSHKITAAVGNNNHFIVVKIEEKISMTQPWKEKKTFWGSPPRD